MENYCCRYSDSPTAEMESRTKQGRGAKRGNRGASGTPVETTEQDRRKNLRSSKGKSSSSSGSKSGTNVNSPAKRKGQRGGCSDGDEGGKSGSEVDSKRKRTDSSRNSPDEDDSSEEKDTKGGNDSDKDSATSSIKGSKDEDKDDFFLPKDKEEEKYIPPPPLPYALCCPKSDCKKRYRQRNGLRFHVSSAHPELLDEVGNIRDTSEIEKMEKEAKERLGVDCSDQAGNEKATDIKAEKASAVEPNDKAGSGNSEKMQNDGSTDSNSNSGASSKTSTPGPSEIKMEIPSNAQPLPPTSSSDAPMPPTAAAAALAAAISVPLPPSSLKGVPGPPLDAKPIPVSAIEGGIPANARPPPPVLQTTLAGAMPLVSSRMQQPQPHIRGPIRPPINARPIVPATGPQMMGPGLGPMANMKPIQPRPTIMPDPTPNLALDDLKKAKKHKKSSNSPGNSPPRNTAGILGMPGHAQQNLNGTSPKTKLDNQIHHHNTANNNAVELPAKSPAHTYSDVSDDEGREEKVRRAMMAQKQPLPPTVQQQPPSPRGPPATSPMPIPMSAPTAIPQPPRAPPPVGAAPHPPPGMPGTGPGGPNPYNFQPFGLPTNASLPTVPVSPQQAAAVSAAAAAAAAAQAVKEKRDMISGPQQGTIEYEKMLLAYGFPPFPYPIPPGMDPSMHMHMLTTDPVYKAKYDKDRLDKEKAFKEQIDRDNREKDRKAGVKLPPPLAALEQSQLQQQQQRPHQPPSPAHVKNEHSLSDSRQEQRKPPPPSHTQHPFSPMISVKPEFRQDTKKEHHHSGSSSHSSHKPEQQPKAEPHPRPPSVPKKAEDEGIKATMETRGPPPATPTSFASLMHPALMGRIPGMGGYDPAMLAGLPPHIMAQLYGSNPYAAAMAAHQQMSGQMRPPSLPGMGPNPNSQNPEDLSRSAALAMAAMSSLGGGGGSSATKALDMLAQQANQYYAAVAASQGQGMPTTTTTSSSSPSSHKIHELQERALKSPAPQRSTASPSMSLSQSLSRGATPTSMLTNTVPTTSTTTKSCTSDLSTFSKRTPSPSARGTPSGARSRSPPLQRHLHTHTHTHFGLGQLGYPLLSPNHPSGIPGVGSPGPPAAHTPFPPAGFPSKLFLIFDFKTPCLFKRPKSLTKSSTEFEIT